MNGVDGFIRSDKKINILFKSAHYPHLEENETFNHLINEFLKPWYGSYVNENSNNNG